MKWRELIKLMPRQMIKKKIMQLGNSQLIPTEIKWLKLNSNMLLVKYVGTQKVITSLPCT